MHIKKMTAAEYNNLIITYQFKKTKFGEMLEAFSRVGQVYAGFVENRTDTIVLLQKRFPQAILIKKNSKPSQTLHLLGTEFQLKVWKSLLTIKSGQLTTYQKIAAAIKNSKAVRAVGSAVGKNPIAMLIPCHRVIRANGTFGQYHWGYARKTLMIQSEIKKRAT